MKPSILKSTIGGVIATIAMTVIMYITPMMGFPKMNAAQMLSDMMHIPLALGWMLHFMIGVVFSIVYGRFLINWLYRISNSWLKGVIFGFGVFVFAQIMMAIMGALMPMPKMEVNMMLMIVGSIMGHLVYGIVTALIVTPTRPSSSSLL